jgi:hypothetical protein
MLAYQLNESTITGDAFNQHTIANQQDIRSKLSYLFGNKVLLSIKVPGKFATSTLLTMINGIENSHVLLGGF